MLQSITLSKANASHLLDLSMPRARVGSIHLGSTRCLRGAVECRLQVHHPMLQRGGLLHSLRETVAVLRQEVGEFLLALAGSALQFRFFGSEARREGFDRRVQLLLQLHLDMPVGLLLTPPQRFALRKLKEHIRQLQDEAAALLTCC